jgi:hypothetical protein
MEGFVDSEGKMMEEITLEQVEELFRFLQGEKIEGVIITSEVMPKLTSDQAWSVIWLLQEHLGALPDNYERCDECGEIYDAYCTGTNNDETGATWCENCDAPEWAWKEMGNYE